MGIFFWAISGASEGDESSSRNAAMLEATGELLPYGTCVNDFAIRGFDTQVSLAILRREFFVLCCSFFVTLLLRTTHDEKPRTFSPRLESISYFMKHDDNSRHILNISGILPPLTIC
jgi:hypothetical protein